MSIVVAAPVPYMIRPAAPKAKPSRAPKAASPARRTTQGWLGAETKPRSPVSRERMSAQRSQSTYAAKAGTR